MRSVLKKLVALLAVLPLVAPQVFAVQRDPAREQAFSMTMTQYGIVATSQTVASQAGAAILAKGGSAVDAAIAANAALGVIEPTWTCCWSGRCRRRRSRCSPSRCAPISA